MNADELPLAQSGLEAYPPDESDSASDDDMDAIDLDFIEITEDDEGAIASPTVSAVSGQPLPDLSILTPPEQPKLDTVTDQGTGADSSVSVDWNLDTVRVVDDVWQDDQTDASVEGTENLDQQEDLSLASDESMHTEAVQTEQQQPDQPSPPDSLQLPTPDVAAADSADLSAVLHQTLADLRTEEAILRQDIAQLRVTYRQIQDQLMETQNNMGQLIQDGLRELEERRQSLKIAVEQLERRQERIRAEMRTNFAGASQDLAIRVQGFKDYLVGSLQDLAAAADQLELVPKAPPPSAKAAPAPTEPEAIPTPKFAEQAFQAQTKQVRRLLDQYRSQPDYYGPPWQLRRTFEPIHAERVSNWFFTQGGRGALKSMGSRLQNILVASAAISVLRELYGDRLRTLVLANAPERLGEWRRGLQDCLGVSRSDFGPDRGILLFEAPEILAQKADRLIRERALPLILIDETEEFINLSILQFPLWLAFAPDPQTPNYGDSRSSGW